MRCSPPPPLSLPTSQMLSSLLSRHPQPTSPSLSYGTAGFRRAALGLEPSFLRLGMLAALRSLRSRGCVGLMVTASHNCETDNGAKLAEADGGMLVAEWEPIATEVVNATDEHILQTLRDVAERVGVEVCIGEERAERAEGAEGAQHGALGGAKEGVEEGAERACVIIGRDTRSHSEGLAALAAEGAALLGAKVEHLGLVTTPQLHHAVRFRNGAEFADLRGLEHLRSRPHYGYFEMLATAFRELCEGERCEPLWVDCAHGVGYHGASALEQSAGGASSPMRLANAPGEGPLNEGCGAEYCQKARLPPRGFSGATGELCCSLDGDADRVVFHYADASGVWRLLDGDKIAALAADFVREQLDALRLDKPLSFAAVQTAYANGASTANLKRTGVPVIMAKTGVKHLHHAALSYDVSIYFEANGHGTVLFSPGAVDVLQRLADGTDTRSTHPRPADVDSEEAGGMASPQAAARRLLRVRRLVNQAIGDALSDMLLVRAILAWRGWDAARWDSMYSDLPSRQTKLAVVDRNAVVVNGDETRALQPEALQQKLDELAAATLSGRCFVRPSGTEDVVRVYAEAQTQEAADTLALEVARATWRLAGGIGPEPTVAVA